MILDEDEHDGEPTYYWNRRTSEKPTLIDHFLEDLPADHYHRKHGYNRTRILYPIKRCKTLQEKFLSRLEGGFDLPGEIIPKLDDQHTCRHGCVYSADEESLKMMSPNLTIHTETNDKVYSIPTYGRPTQGGCTCFDQEDTNDLLLWNLGSGQFVDYLFLHNHLHRTVSSGIAMNATYNSRKSSLSGIGLKTALTYHQFVRVCTGYTKMIEL